MRLIEQRMIFSLLYSALDGIYAEMPIWKNPFLLKKARYNYSQIPVGVEPVKMLFFKRISILLLLLFVSACSNNSVITPPASISSSDEPTVKQLYAHYNEWRGVRYREGGLSKQGVDCSGFVHLAYKNKLRKFIPRTTELMSSSGRVVDASHLRPGDVLFFKTGLKIRHVGIYTGKGEFIHASSSRGVTRSKLGNPYWQDAYWMARRY